MKVITNTSDRFELRSAPWVMNTLFGATCVVLLWLGFKAFLSGDTEKALSAFVTGGMFGVAFICLARRDHLVLDRAAGTMEIRHATIWGRSRECFELCDFERASTQTHFGTNNNIRTYRLALIMAGIHPKDVHNITPVYSGGSGAEEAADAINAWYKGVTG